MIQAGGIIERISRELKIVAIKSPQSSQRANPEKSLAVLEDADHPIVAEAIFGGEMLEFDSRLQACERAPALRIHGACKEAE